MKILLINDDHWHPGKVSDEGVKPLEKQGFEFDLMKDGDAFLKTELGKYPVILFVKSDNRTGTDNAKWVTEEVRKALIAYVQGGGGLFVIHSGTASYNDMADIHALFSGLFMTHPAQLPVTFTPKAGHPITQGVQAFTEMDEHYFMNMHEEPVEMFLTGTSRHGSLPAGWTRMEGWGRVCVLTPGHNAEGWLNPNFQRILANALNWCAGEA